MIQPETFYKETSQNFRDLNIKIDHLHGKTQKDIQDLTKVVGEVNGKIDTHIAVVNALEEKEDEQIDRSNKKAYFITGIIVTVGFGLFKIIEALTS